LAGRRLGFQIQLFGPHNQKQWDVAADAVLSKLNSDANGCKHISDVSVNDELLRAATSRRPTVTEKAFEGVPLATLSSASRGACIEAIARSVDAQLHSNITPASAALKCVNGRRRGWNRTTYDWNRDGTRVECKSAQLSWDQANNRWKVCFVSVKLELQDGPAFDELQLALFTPRGIYIYRHDGKRGVCGGRLMAICGQTVHIYGRCGDACWNSGLDVILNKLDDSGCVRIAFIEWGV